MITPFPKKVLVCGSGTMGSGIALVCAKAGFETQLFDLNTEVLKKAEASNKEFAEAQLKKGRWNEDEAGKVVNKLLYTASLNEIHADLVIEAIVEKIEVKLQLFHDLADRLPENAILASNTSSLSVTEIARQLPRPEKMAGLHFFNPAPLMKLVEIVETDLTAPEVLETLGSFIRKLGKTAVVCKDAPGFIVNRVARHYYLEAMRIGENTGASYELIDTALENAGFRMGPFHLMDMIGNDVNLAVSRSLYEAFQQAPRFAPSSIQEEKVRKGELGRKTGRGFFEC